MHFTLSWYETSVIYSESLVYCYPHYNRQRILVLLLLLSTTTITTTTTYLDYSYKNDLYHLCSTSLNI